jgi:hypothetical protein
MNTKGKSNDSQMQTLRQNQVDLLWALHQMQLQAKGFIPIAKTKP